MYPWQNESNIHLPGGAVSVAHQFLRCVLHQLAPNGIFTQMFQTHATDKARLQFFKSIIQALIDFNELNPVAPLQFLLEVRVRIKFLVSQIKTYKQNSSISINPSIKKLKFLCSPDFEQQKNTSRGKPTDYFGKYGLLFGLPSFGSRSRTIFTIMDQCISTARDFL